MPVTNPSLHIIYQQFDRLKPAASHAVSTAVDQAGFSCGFILHFALPIHEHVHLLINYSPNYYSSDYNNLSRTSRPVGRLVCSEAQQSSLLYDSLFTFFLAGKK
jgi:hypothetical protein